MKNYTIYIQIYNDLGELCDKKLVFPTLEDMTVAFWKNGIWTVAKNTFELKELLDY